MKRLFKSKTKHHGEVLLNWHGSPEQEFEFIAEAFHLTAKEAALRNDPHFGLHGDPMLDFRAYPIVYLYRHALELYMKGFILEGHPILSLKGTGEVDPKSLLRNHNLDSLRQDVERIVEAFGWGWDLQQPHFRTVEEFRRVIAELHDVDKGSYSFRYSLNTDGKASLPEYFRFNLLEFCSILDELLPIFRGMEAAAHDDLQARYEMMAEGREPEMGNSDYEPGDYEPGDE